ncbi:hypothetical protein A0H81_14109 [Grifola frondosa]|uniref:Uncharacterized protein n=1 Tax=Grifola frondosa TaxID=5627 RepID=A0A1C7LT33_GRIFR|nr:hypothetical protein A0H81_14109 [Grifola frondosa]
MSPTTSPTTYSLVFDARSTGTRHALMALLRSSGLPGCRSSADPGRRWYFWKSVVHKVSSLQKYTGHYSEVSANNRLTPRTFLAAGKTSNLAVSLVLQNDPFTWCLL